MASQLDGVGRIRHSIDDVSVFAFLPEAAMVSQTMEPTAGSADANIERFDSNRCDGCGQIVART